MASDKLSGVMVLYEQSVAYATIIKQGLYDGRLGRVSVFGYGKES